MSHPSIYIYTFTIPQSVIDDNGHVNNVAYVQWMQDAAIRHGEALDFKTPENASWFAREHHIKYFLPAFLGDEIVVRTWITEWKRQLPDGLLRSLKINGQRDWIEPRRRMDQFPKRLQSVVTDKRL